MIGGLRISLVNAAVMCSDGNRCSSCAVIVKLGH